MWTSEATSDIDMEYMDYILILTWSSKLYLLKPIVKLTNLLGVHTDQYKAMGQSTPLQWRDLAVTTGPNGRAWHCKNGLA